MKKGMHEGFQGLQTMRADIRHRVLGAAHSGDFVSAALQLAMHAQQACNKP